MELQELFSAIDLMFCTDNPEWDYAYILGYLHAFYALNRISEEMKNTLVSYAFTKCDQLRRKKCALN